MAGTCGSIKYEELQTFSQDEKEVRSVAGKLLNWGCCTRCVFRFIGEKNIDIFKKPIEELSAWLASCAECEEAPVEDGISKDNQTTTEGGVCIACLGILQNHYSTTEFMHEIEKKVKENDHEYSDFICSLSTPVLVLIREHAIWLSLREQAKDMFFGRKLNDITPIKDVWKWTNGPKLADILGVPVDQNSKFDISLNFVHPATNKECSFLFDLFPHVFKQRKTSRFGWEVFTRANVQKAINDMSENKFKKNYRCPPRRQALPCDCDPISSTYDALFIAGRYNKYSRMLSQTPWLVDGERKTVSSIQELICDPIVKHVKSGEHRFSASGREDVDVKCLGTGRPFVIECIDPHVVNFSRADMRKLQKEINEATQEVAVRDLQIVTREDTTFLKEGEIEKTKCYSALCWSPQKVTQEKLDELKEIKDLVLLQNTPIRVLHRRPLATRERTIHVASGQVKDDNHFLLSVKTQAGTYVKEFVHGDFGRTHPNLGSLLGMDCDILELDVESVDIDWPTPVDSIEAVKQDNGDH